MLNVLVIGNTEQQSAKTLELIAGEREYFSRDTKRYATNFLTYDAAIKKRYEMPVPEVLGNTDIVVIDGLDRAVRDAQTPEEINHLLRYLDETCSLQGIPIVYSTLGRKSRKRAAIVRDILPKVLNHSEAISSSLPSFMPLYHIGYDKKKLKLEVDAASMYRVFSKRYDSKPAA